MSLIRTFAAIFFLTAIAFAGDRGFKVVGWGVILDVPAGLRDVVSVAANQAISLALKSDGAVIQWGLDPINYAVPAGLTRAVAIASGRSFKLALVPNGTEKLPPIMFMHPYSQKVPAGRTLLLKADAVGEQVAYQWRKDGSNIVGATRSVYLIETNLPVNAGVYSVVASNPYGSVTSSNAVITVPIPGGLEFPSDTFTVPEAAQTITIPVLRRGSLASAATVQYSTHSESATPGLDYTETTGEFHFPVNQGTNYFTVPILDDKIVEGDETFTVTLAGEGLGERTTARVHIQDNDAPIQFLRADYTVTEGVEPYIVLGVGRQGTGGAAANVNYTTRTVTAVPGVDYIDIGGTLTLQFGPGENYEEISIPILDDNLPEPPKSFTVILSGPDVGTTNTARVTILDADLGFAFTQQTLNVFEGVNSNATIGVTRFGDLGTTGSIAYRTSPGRGSAAPGADYIATQGTLEFAVGERTKTFDVPILDDVLTEGVEDFVAELYSTTSTNISAPRNFITVNILDDDRGLQFSQPDYYVPEGAQAATLTVMRAGTAAVSSSARIIYSTLSDTAKPGSDYVETTGELNFAPGETTKTFTIRLLDDNEVEGPETFMVKLFPLEGALAQITTATVHIQDDEHGFELGGDAYLTEGATTNAILTISRSGSNAPPAAVRYTTQAGTAKPGEDYMETTGTVQFAAGENSKTISIQILDDNIREQSEFFTVVLSSDSPLGSRTSAHVYISDDDSPLGFTQSTIYTSEIYSNAVLTVAREGTSSERARIIFATRGLTAVPGVDYIETTGALDFAPGDKSKNVIIPLLNDDQVDGMKTFTVTLFAIEGTLGTNINAAVTIQDDERPVWLDLSSTNLARPDGPVRILSRLPDGKIFMGGAFTNVDDHSTPGLARLNRDGSVDRTFSSGFIPGSAVNEVAVGRDGRALFAGSVTRSGETRSRNLGRFKADGAWDDSFQGGLSVTVDQQGNQLGTISTIQVLADGRILIGGSFQYVGNSVRNGFARLNADGTLDSSFAPNFGPVKKLRVQEDGRILATYAYGLIARFLADGQRDSTFQPEIDQSQIFDFELQPDGRIFVAGSFPTVSGIVRPGLARLKANGTVDESFAVVPPLVQSGSPFVWRVWLSGDGGVVAHSSAVGLFRASPNGTVIAQFGGIDLQTALSETNGTILIGGSFSQVWPFAAPFLARLRNDGNGKGVTLANSQFSTTEGSPFVEISLERWGILSESFTVRARSVDGSATAGSDYIALNQEITFAPGERQKTVRVQILDDGRLERTEDFSLNLEAVTPGIALGGASTVFIQDDEVEPESDRGFQTIFLGGAIAALEATADGRIYVNASGLARFSADGTLDASFNFRGDNSFTIQGMDVQPDGQLIARTYDWSTGEGRAIRIRTDGTLDTNFVQTLYCDQGKVAIRSDGKVLLTDVCAGELRLLNADGSTNRIFALPDIGSIQVLRPLGDGSILLGGDYGFARLTATGEIAMTLNVDGPIICITPLPNGQFMVGGGFSQIADQPRPGIARLNPDLSVDATFNVGAGPNSFPIIGIAAGPDGRLLVGGQFNEFAGRPRNGLVRLKPDGAVDDSDNSDLPPGFRVVSFAPQAGGVVVAALTGWGGVDGPPVRGIIERIRYDSVVSVVDFAFAHLAAGASQAFAKIDLERRGDTTEPAIVRYRAAGPGYPEFAGIAQFSPGQRFLSIELPIAGRYLERPPSGINLDLTDVSGSTVLGLSHADLTIEDDSVPGAVNHAFAPFPRLNQSGAAGWVPSHSLAVQADGKILFGSYFPANADGLPNSLIRLNTDGSLDPSFHTDAGIGFVALTADGKILAPGGPNGVERFLSDGAFDTAFNPTDQIPYAAVVLPLPNRGVLVGGQIRYANNGLMPGIARLRENGSLDQIFRPSESINNATALALTADGSLLLANFDGSQTRLLLLGPDGQVNAAFKSPKFNGLVSAFAVQPDNRIVVGGSFSQANGIARAGIARVQPNGELDSSFDPGLGFTTGGTNQVGSVTALLLLPDGGILAGGAFSHVAGVPRWNLARLDSTGNFDPAYGPEKGLYSLAPNPSFVSSLVLMPDGDILAAGAFDYAGQFLHPLLVRLRGATEFELAPPRLLQTGEAELTIPATAGGVILETATRLSPADWQPIATNNTTVPLNYREPPGAPASKRFYRARH